VLPDPTVTPTISVEAAAEVLGISRSACYRAVQAGQVPGLRFGRTWRVPVAPLRTLLGMDVAQDAPSTVEGRGAVSTPGLQAVPEVEDTG
jgi:excisionase family DNA binding protein